MQNDSEDIVFTLKLGQYVVQNNRYMGAVNNTTSISNDVYRG